MMGPAMNAVTSIFMASPDDETKLRASASSDCAGRYSRVSGTLDVAWDENRLVSVDGHGVVVEAIVDLQVFLGGRGVGEGELSGPSGTVVARNRGGRVGGKWQGGVRGYGCRNQPRPQLDFATGFNHLGNR